MAHAIDPEARRDVDDREHQLVGDQDPRHPRAGDAGLLDELRQVDDIHRPRDGEEELHDADGDGEPAIHGQRLVESAS